MAPVLHCVRHAQGYHNLDKDGVDTEQIRDPDLTDRGREQCERLREDFPFQDKIDCILASPIRRTIQTALIGFQPAIEKRGLKLLLTPMAQETSDKPSDTGSELDKLQEEYGGRIDAQRMTADWNTNKGQWHMDWVSIEKHAVELRQYISGLDCENVVLVAHGGFMHYFTEDWSDNPGSEGETGWDNTEFRSYKFIKGGGAHLQETKDSRERRTRSERAPGGYRPENGPADQE